MNIYYILYKFEKKKYLMIYLKVINFKNAFDNNNF